MAARPDDFELPGLRLGAAGERAARPWVSAAGGNVSTGGGEQMLDLALGFGSLVFGHSHPAGVAGEFAAGPRDGAGTAFAPGLGDLYGHELRERANRAICEWAARAWGTGAGTGTGSDSGATATMRRADDLACVVLHSGSEAVETAIKTALLATGRPNIVAFEGGYHGTFGLALAVTHGARFREPFASQYARGTVGFAPFGEVPVLDEHTACVVVEPIQGRAGVIAPDDGYLDLLRAECDRVGALLVVDDVLVGCGRAGEQLAGAACDPDIVCLGKALGGGLPASAVIARRRVAEAAWGMVEGEAIHTATFVAHPLACLAALRTLELLPGDDDLARLGDDWHADLHALADATGLTLRGRGLLWALDTERDGGGLDLAMRLLDAGLVVLPSGPTGSSVTLLPAVTTTAEERATALLKIGAASASGS